MNVGDVPTAADKADSTFKLQTRHVRNHDDSAVYLDKVSLSWEQLTPMRSMGLPLSLTLT